MKEFSLNLKTRLRSVYGRHNVEFMAAAVGMLVFILVYGYKILNPMNISWMYHGLSTDFTQHYLGWKGFRNSAWTFPIGLMDQLTYPDKVSIIYTDSIPIFALFFKLFNPILPDRFQYFGFWGILTYALNGVFASMILKRYLKSKLNVILGSLFFIFSFQMLERMYFHSALAAHWLILLPIYLIIIRRELSLRKKILLWGIVGALCPLIHSYFILFDGIILAGFMLAVIIDRDGIEDSNKKRLIAAGLSFLSFVLVGLFTLFILGAFDNTVADLNGSVDNFGLDLNAFFNEMGAGYFPEVFSYRKGHRIYYLGAGIIILTMITAIQIIRHKDWDFFKKRKNTIIAIAATYILALIVACSPTITLNGNVIIHYPLPELVKNIWSVFKNTARTSWVCIYLIFLFAICADYKYVSRELKTSFLIFAFLIQFTDISPYLIERHGKIITETNVKEFDPHLGTDFLDNLIATHGIKHFVLGPTYDPGPFKFLTGYAMSRHLTTNVFRLARGNSKDVKAEFKKALYNPNTESLYILKSEDADYAFDDCGINWMETEGFIIGIVGEW